MYPTPSVGICTPPTSDLLPLPSYLYPPTSTLLPLPPVMTTGEGGNRRDVVTYERALAKLTLEQVMWFVVIVIGCYCGCL